MSLFQCFGPRRRREPVNAHDRRRIRRSLRSKLSSRATLSLPFSDGPFSSAVSSNGSWIHSAAAATDTGGESGRSQPGAITCPKTTSVATSSSPPPSTDSPAPAESSQPATSSKAASSGHSTTPPTSPSSSSAGGSGVLSAHLRSPPPTALAAFPPPIHPIKPVDRGNPRLPPLRSRSDSVGSTSASMERAVQRSLSLQSITDDSAKTAPSRAPATSADPSPLTTALRPLPTGPPSSFSSQHGAAIFSPASSLCESPTHHASFQSWLQTGSARSTGSPPASARIRALSLAAETNLSSDFSVHLYVDPPRSARSAAILAACSNAAAAKAAHLSRSRSSQAVDYFGILPTTLEEELEEWESIPDPGGAGTSLRVSPDASSIALDTADGHKIVSLADMSSRSPSMTQHSSSLADVSADVIVDVCATDTGVEMGRDFGGAGLAGEDVMSTVGEDAMSTVGTACETATVECSRLAACSFPGGTIMSSLHSTASGSLLGMIAARMPQPHARQHGPAVDAHDNASAPLWEDSAEEREDTASLGQHSEGCVEELGGGGAIADSAGIPLPSASIAAYSSLEFAPPSRGRYARGARHGAAELRDSQASDLLDRAGAVSVARADVAAAAAAADLVAGVAAARRRDGGAEQPAACRVCCGRLNVTAADRDTARCVRCIWVQSSPPLPCVCGPAASTACLWARGSHPTCHHGLCQPRQLSWLFHGSAGAR